MLLPCCCGMVVLSAGGCDSRINPSAHRLLLPDLPPEWAEILGPAQWRIEWIDSGGTYRTMETDYAGAPELDVLSGWANPVLAYPFWPDRGLLPGMMRPAGALYPFDVRDGELCLSWRGGVDALVYREMAAEVSRNGSVNQKRQPPYFDWPRFRELLESTALAGELIADPWRADWRSIAQRTIQSGFDRRRVKAQAVEGLLVTGVPERPFTGPSPFAGPLVPETGL